MKVKFFLTFLFCLFSTSVIYAGTSSFKPSVFERDGETYSIEIKYPQIIKQSNLPGIKRVNLALKDFALKPTKELFLSYKEENAVFLKEKEIPSSINSFTADFSMVYLTDQFVSVKFDQYSYGIGAAHGLSSLRCFNYDLISGKLVSLKNLFDPDFNYSDQLFKIIVLDIKKQYLDDGVDIDDFMEKWIEEGAFSKA